MDPQRSYGHHDRTMRVLYETLATADASCSAEEMRELLARNHATLLQPLASCKPHNSQSGATLRSGKVAWRGQQTEVKEAMRIFLERCSVVLDLDQIQTHALFQSFLRAEAVDSVTFSDATINSLLEFYYDERLCTLSCLSVLLRNCEDDAHVYRDQCIEAVDKLLDQGLINNLLDDYDSLLSVGGAVAGSGSAGDAVATALTPRQLSMRADNVVLERVAMLDVLFFVFYTRSECSVDGLVNLLRLFQRQDFGTKLSQHLTQHVTPQGREAARRIGPMFVLILIEVMNLESLLDEAVDPDVSDGVLAAHPLLRDGLDGVLSVDRILSADWGSLPVHSPVLLAWSVLLVRAAAHIDNAGAAADAADDMAVLQSQFRVHGQRALRHHVFRFLADECVNEHVLQTDASNLTGYKSVVKGVLAGVLSAFHVSFLPAFDDILDLACTLFTGQPSLCSQFWAHDAARPSLRSLLDTARQRFPAEFSAFPRLLTALSGSPDGAQHVFTMLHELPSLTCMLSRLATSPSDTWSVGSAIAASRTSTPRGGGDSGAASPTSLVDDVSSGDDDILLYRLKRACYVDGVTLPAGTIGRVVSPPGAAPVVQWALSYSAWDVLYRRVAVLLHRLGSGHRASSQLLQDVTTVMQLLHAVFAQHPSLVHHVPLPLALTGDPPAEPHAPLALLAAQIDVVQYVAEISPLPPDALDLLRVTLRLLGCWAHTYPLQVWHLLTKRGLIPVHVRSPAAAVDPPEQQQQQQQGDTLEPADAVRGTASIDGTLRRVLRGAECAAGRYGVTLALLELLQTLGIASRQWLRSLPEQQHQQDTCPAADESTALPAFVADSAFDFHDGVAYVRADILANYQSWRYQSIVERWQIGLYSLSMLHHVLLDARPNGTAWQDELLLALLHDTSLHRPLLHVIGVGASVLQRMFSRRKPNESRTFESLIVYSLATLDRVLQLRAAMPAGAMGASALEHSMMSRTVGKDGESLILVLAGYIAYPLNYQVPLLATRILTCLCRLSVHMQPRPPSLVGYLGAQAESLRAHFVTALRRNRGSELLRVAVLDLVAAAIDSQFGLAEYFLNVAEASKTNFSGAGSKEPPRGSVRSQMLGAGASATTAAAEAAAAAADAGVAALTDALPRDSVVTAVLALVRDSRVFLQHKPRLLATALRLLHVLWLSGQHRRVLQSLRSQQAFWTAFTAPLSEPMDAASAADVDASIESLPDTLAEVLRGSATVVGAAGDTLTMPCVSNGDDGDDDVRNNAYRVQCRGWIFATLALHLYHTPSDEAVDDALRAVLARAAQSGRYEAWIKDAARLSFDPACVAALQELATSLNIAAPSVFACVPRNTYGSAHVYDTHCIALKLGVTPSLVARLADTHSSRINNNYHKNKNNNNINNNNIGDGGDALVDDVEVRVAEFLRQSIRANYLYSLADAELVLLRSWRAFCELSTTRGGAVSLCASDKPGLPFLLLDSLTQVLERESRTGVVASLMLQEVCGLVMTLLHAWTFNGAHAKAALGTGPGPTSPTAVASAALGTAGTAASLLMGRPIAGAAGLPPLPTPAVAEDPSFKLEMAHTLQLLQRLSVFVAHVSQLRAPPAPLLSPLLTSILLLFRHAELLRDAAVPAAATAAAAADSDEDRVFGEVAAALLPSLCAIVRDCASVRGVAVAALEVLVRQFRPLDAGLSVLSHFDVIPTVLQALTQHVLAAAHSGGQSQAAAPANAHRVPADAVDDEVFGAASSAGADASSSLDALSFAETMLNLLLALSCEGESAAMLAMHHIVQHVSAVSVLLATEPAFNGLPPYTPSGEVNVWHRAWCLILRLLTSMLQSLRHEEGFFGDALQFVSLHHTRMTDVLATSALTLAALDEMQLVTGLLAELARIGWQHFSFTMPKEQTRSVHAGAMRLVHHFVLLLVQPVALARAARPVSRSETRAAAVEVPMRPPAVQRARTSADLSPAVQRKRRSVSDVAAGTATPRPAPPISLGGSVTPLLGTSAGAGSARRSSSESPARSSSVDTVARRSLSELDSPQLGRSTTSPSPSRMSPLRTTGLFASSVTRSPPLTPKGSSGSGGSGAGSTGLGGSGSGAAGVAGSVAATASAAPSSSASASGTMPSAGSAKEAQGYRVDEIPFLLQIEHRMYLVLRNAFILLRTMTPSPFAQASSDAAMTSLAMARRGMDVGTPDWLNGSVLLFTHCMHTSPKQPPSLGVLLSCMNHCLYTIKRASLETRGSVAAIDAFYAAHHRLLLFVIDSCALLTLTHVVAYLSLPSSHPVHVEVREDASGELEAFVQRVVRYYQRVDGTPKDTLAFWKVVHGFVKQLRQRDDPSNEWTSPRKQV